MNILVIGSGGREHALVYGLNKSSTVEKIYVLPGNGGINKQAEQAAISADDHSQIVNFCKENSIDLVVVGPEAPLVDGLVDTLEQNNIKAFGPKAAAAKIEGSKQFMKDAVSKYGLPTAEYQNFDNPEAAKLYVKEKGAPIVIKTDGLAAGKGVTLAATEEEALEAIDEFFAGKFGDAGKRIVVEEFLEGEEASFFAISDGKTVIPFGSAQDHKAVGDGDTGPNTGGMGAYSPAPVVSQDMAGRIMDEIITPFIDGMRNDGIPYQGVLFAGIMIDKQGNPKLLEFNVRFGDPEAQVLIPRLDSDLADILLAAAEGNLDQVNVEFSNDTAICVVMAAKGYPGSYDKGTKINNIEQAEALENIVIFHAGTKYDEANLLATGGRVLGVTALGSDIIEAQSKAYQAVDKIDWQEGFCRRDIGWRAVDRIKIAS